MPENLKTTIDFFEHTWGSVQLFGALPAEDEFPQVFGDLNIDADMLDTAFFDAFGQRPPGVALKRHGSDTLSNLADYVFRRFVPRWKRYCMDMLAEYDPATNYSREESETISRTGSGKDTTTRTYPEYKETTKSGHAVKTSSAANVYGFDSWAAVPADDGDTTTVYTQTDGSGNTLPGDTLEITGSQVVEFDHGTGESTTRGLTASGNIGTMTAAQMLRDDLDYYEKCGDIVDMMIKEIADLLTLPIYD